MSEEVEDNTNTDENAQIETAPVSRKSKTPLISSAPIIIGVVGLCAFAIWLNRAQVTSSALETYLKSKGVDANIQIDEFGPNFANFSKLQIHKNGKDTVLAQNGHIAWHFNDKNQLVLENLDAKNLYVAIGINDKGIDFGALAPLFEGKKSGAKTLIGDLNFKDLKLDIATNYGQFQFHGALIGNGDKEIGANFFIFAPQEILKANKAPQIALKTGPINKAPYELSFNFKGNEIQLGQKFLSKDFQIGQFDADLNGHANLGENGKSPIIDLFPSQIRAKYLNFKNTKINNALIKTQNIHAQIGNDFARDFEIGANGQFSFSALEIAKNNIGQSTMDFALSRQKDGKAKIDLQSRTNGFNLGVFGKQSDLKAKFNLVVPNLANFENSPIAGEIGGNLRGLKLLKLIGENEALRQTGFANIFDNANINGAFKLDGKLPNMTLRPIGAIKISNGAKSYIWFEPNNNLAPNLLRINGETSGFNLTLGGKLKGLGDTGLAINSNLNSLIFNHQNLAIDLAQTNANNLQYAGQLFDLNLKNARIVQSKNSNINADFVGSANFHGAQSQGIANIAGNLRNKIINANVAGKFSKISMPSFNAQNLDINANVRGNPNTSLQLDTKLKLAALNSKDIESKNLNLSADGNLNLGKAISFNGSVSGNAAYLRANSTKIENPQFAGDINVKTGENGIALNASSCLSVEFSRLLSESSTLSDTLGKLCPDNLGRIVSVNENATTIYAQANIGKSTFKMGNSNDAPIISLNQLIGKFTPSKNGTTVFNGKALDLKLQFKTSPNEWAQITSQNTNINFINNKLGTQIDANIEKFDALNLPVTITGALNGKFLVPSNQKPSANFELKDIYVSDKSPSPNFAPFKLNGRGQLQNDALNIFGNAKIAQHEGDIAQLFLEHNLQSGKGNVVIDASSLTFIPWVSGNEPIKLEAKDIVPPLKGLFNNTNGTLDTRAGISWEPNSPMQSYAKIATENLDFDTPFGVVKGVNGQVQIDDLLKLKTSNQQIVKVKSFDPGLPIENGNLGFELNGNNSIDLNLISWAFADGVLSMRPLNIPFGQMPNNFIIDAKNIDIAKLLRLAKIPNLEIDGIMSGTLPINIVDNTFEIAGGHLYGEGEGVLRYTGPDFGPPKTKPTTAQKIKAKLFGKPTPSATEIAIGALKELHYRVLRIDVDGRITGEMTFGILLEGSNPQLLQNHPIRLKVKARLPIGEMRAQYDNFFVSSDQMAIEQLNKIAPEIFKPKE